jgi:hypothetical protein
MAPQDLEQDVRHDAAGTQSGVLDSMTPDFVPDSEQEKNKQVDEQEKNKQVYFSGYERQKKKGPNIQPLRGFEPCTS